MVKTKQILILIFALLISCHFVFGQTEKPQLKLVDVFGKLNSESRSVRIDLLVQEVSNVKNSKGAILIFCGKICQYGEVEAHIRGVHHKLNLRGVDKKDYLIIFGGYKETQTTELWLIPENTCPPLDRSEVEIEKVSFEGKYKRKIEYYECC